MYETQTESSSLFLMIFLLFRLADLFQQHQNLLEEDVKNNFFPTEKSNSQSVKQLTKQILYCLQPAVRSDITIFDISSDDNLSETILRSICQCKSSLSLSLSL